MFLCSKKIIHKLYDGLENQQRLILAGDEKRRESFKEMKNEFKRLFTKHFWRNYLEFCKNILSKKKIYREALFTMPSCVGITYQW